MPKFREITGQFVGYIPDSIDTDIVPDRAPMNGRVTFTPVFTGGVIAFPELMPPEFAHPRTIHARIVDGFVQVEVNEGEGNDEQIVLQPLTLMVTVDDEASQVWSWRAEFDEILIGASDEYVKIPAWSFRVPDGTGPVDLTELVPLKSGGSVDVTKGPRGAGLQNITAIDGQLVFAYSDGEETTVPIPEAVQGPQGEPGPAGADGEQGPEGPQGPAGEIPDLLVSNISDATPTGKNLMLAATEGAARSALGLAAGATATSGSLAELQTGTSSTPRVWTPANIANYTKAQIKETQTAVNLKEFGVARDGETDDAAAIQAALNASVGRELRFPEGTYKILSTVNIPSGTKITADAGAKIDFSDVAPTGSYRYGFRAQGSLGVTANLGANASKGLFSISVTNASGFAAGDWVRISSNATYPYPGAVSRRGEIKRIRSVAGNEVLFEQALYDSYITADSAVMTKINMVTNISISGLEFIGADTPLHADRAVSLEFVAGFDIVGNVFDKIDQYCVYVRSCVTGEVSRNRFRGVPYDGVNGLIHYAVLFSSSTQWVRCHSNHGEQVRHLITISAPSNDPGQPRHITCTGNIAQNMQAGIGGRSWAYECHGVGENILFQGNIADGCYGGFVTRGPGVAFIGNTIRNWSVSALHIHADTRDARDIVIQNNIVQDRARDIDNPATVIAAVRVEPGGATKISNVIISDNTITFDIPNAPAVRIEESSVAAESFIVRDNNIVHAGATVPTISIKATGATTTGNYINGNLEGDSTLDSTRSSAVSTMPRHAVGTSAGALLSGCLYGVRAKVTKTGRYTTVRFCTGTTAPVLTDFRVGIWDSSGAILAESINYSSQVNASSTVYELAVDSPTLLLAGQDVYIGFGALGSTVGTYRGVASAVGITGLEPALVRQNTTWGGGALKALLPQLGAAVVWVELV